MLRRGPGSPSRSRKLLVINHTQPKAKQRLVLGRWRITVQLRRAEKTRSLDLLQKLDKGFTALGADFHVEAHLVLWIDLRPDVDEPHPRRHQLLDIGEGLGPRNAFAVEQLIQEPRAIH